MLSHIVPAAICVLDASRSHTCIRARAERLRDPLLDAYARAACYWAENHYEWSNEQHAAFASALLLWAVDDDPQVVVISRQDCAPPLARYPLSSRSSHRGYIRDRLRACVGEGVASSDGDRVDPRFEILRVVRRSGLCAI